MNKELSAQTTAAAAPQFDLSNSHHVNMRRLMSDVYARFATAVAANDDLVADKYQSMAEGLTRVAKEVLDDSSLFILCFALEMMMFRLRSATRIIKWESAA